MLRGSATILESCSLASGRLRSVAYPYLVRNPIYFPRLAPIIRERLFKVGRIRGQVRPNESNEYSLAINRILGEELTASILEFADLWRVKYADFAVGPIQAPLVRLWIIEA